MRLCVCVALTVLPAVAAADEPTDYTREAADLMTIAACGNAAVSDAIPQRFPRKVIDAHCSRMTRVYDHHRRWWVAKASRFIGKLRPSDAPQTIVYPFGGGDLSAALTAFPDASDITTLSLEPAGDVRTVDTISAKQLAIDLANISAGIRRLYNAGHSTTEVLRDAVHAQLPGMMMFALAGLALHDMDLVRVRYVHLEADGSVAYTTDAVSGSVEIQFRPRGTPDAPIRTFRHLHANLDDSHAPATSPVIKHLVAKGRVSVMTKAASFLLWRDDFSVIRDYVLANAAWMISDASGIPPAAATAAGFEHVTYGQFTAPYFTRDPNNVRAAMIKLWAAQPHRDVPFRFGYPDKANHNHLLVMRRAQK